MKAITVLIIDEYPDVRGLLARGLESLDDFRVVATTGNPLLAAELAHKLRPDVIIADFRRRGPSREEMFRWIGLSSPRSRLVVLTTYMHDGEEEALLRAGASRCLLKGTTVKQLAHELRILTAGKGAAQAREMSA